MAECLFADNASSTVATAINNVATSVTLSAGTGIKFPNPGANQYFIGSFTDAATGLITEVVRVTARSGDTLTIIRAQEGTVGQNWNGGDLFANLCTSGTQALFAQPDDLQQQISNTGVDSSPVGSPNAVVISPVNQPVSLAAMTGMHLRIKKNGATNTGATTLTVGSLTGNIIFPGGGTLAGGELPANGYFCVVGDGVNFQLQNVAAGAGSGVPTTRQINTTNGLTGGGDLSANRTLQPVYGSVANTVCQGNDPRLVGGGVFISTTVGLALNSSGTFTHGLTLVAGANAPSQIKIWLLCVTAVLGFSINDVVELANSNEFGGSNQAGAQAWGNTTTIGWSTTGQILIVNKTGGSPQNITLSNWQLFMTARP